jgi:hypothetical protein
MNKKTKDKLSYSVDDGHGRIERWIIGFYTGIFGWTVRKDPKGQSILIGIDFYDPVKAEQIRSSNGLKKR